MVKISYTRVAGAVQSLVYTFDVSALSVWGSWIIIKFLAFNDLRLMAIVWCLVFTAWVYAQRKQHVKSMRE
jgi:hypothetical protein